MNEHDTTTSNLTNHVQGKISLLFQQNCTKSYSTFGHTRSLWVEASIKLHMKVNIVEL